MSTLLVVGPLKKEPYFAASPSRINVQWTDTSGKAFILLLSVDFIQINLSSTEITIKNLLGFKFMLCTNI